MGITPAAVPLSLSFHSVPLLLPFTTQTCCLLRHKQAIVDGEIKEISLEDFKGKYLVFFF